MLECPSTLRVSQMLESRSNALSSGLQVKEFCIITGSRILNFIEFFKNFSEYIFCKHLLYSSSLEIRRVIFFRFDVI